MKSGELDEKIQIEEVSVSQDDIGEKVFTWSVFAEVWAGIVEVTGAEYFAAAKVNAENTVRFQIRYLAGVKRTMRILWNGDYYDIKAVNPIGGRKSGLEITAQAQVH